MKFLQNLEFVCYRIIQLQKNTVLSSDTKLQPNWKENCKPIADSVIGVVRLCANQMFLLTRYELNSRLDFMV